MPDTTTAPYGAWTSPITAESIASGSMSIGQFEFADGDIYWIEGRPSEGGRNVIVRRTDDGTTSDVNAPPLNARNRVHEYGGGAMLVSDGVVYFSNYSDNRIYRQPIGGSAEPLTEERSWRYADAVHDRQRNRLICVREDHTTSSIDAVATIVAIDLGSGAQTVLVEGKDFYSTPRISPDGRTLSWLEWNHPNMPWDGTELFIGDLGDDGTLVTRVPVAGGREESIYQPQWAPDGSLVFISDRSGWWNIYRRASGAIETLTSMQVEFGAPQWVFHERRYGFAADGTIVCVFEQNGNSQVARLDPATKRLDLVQTPFTSVRDIRVDGDRVLLAGGSPTESRMLLLLDLSTGEKSVLARTSDVAVDPEYVSAAEPIEFPTSGNLTAHAFYYAPRNPDFVAPKGEKPPLLVLSHGGPTGSTTSMLNLQVQFWTSRGFAVIDVNYGGSTGYGRAYRERLKGAWGIVDVEDCINGARFLINRGDVDGARVCIRGGSAGGYTTLAALTFHHFFRAGASYYGISDLEALEKEGHKFEARYNHSLIGPYPERRDLYLERSPIHFVDRIDCPIILFQGLEDRVVPPNQSEAMFDAVRAKGIPVAYVPFEGEQHGFRKAETIKRSLEAELYFYSRVFGFTPADTIEPVPIENMA